MSETIKLHGPFDVELKIYCTDGETVAVVTYQLGHAQFPTSSDIWEACTKSETEIKERMTDAWRLCTKREYFDFIMSEMTGTSVDFALPGKDDWDRE